MGTLRALGRVLLRAIKIPDDFPTIVEWLGALIPGVGLIVLAIINGWGFEAWAIAVLLGLLILVLCVAVKLEKEAYAIRNNVPVKCEIKKLASQLRLTPILKANDKGLMIPHRLEVMLHTTFYNSGQLTMLLKDIEVRLVAKRSWLKGQREFAVKSIPKLETIEGARLTAQVDGFAINACLCGPFYLGTILEFADGIGEILLRRPTLEVTFQVRNQHKQVVYVLPNWLALSKKKMLDNFWETIENIEYAEST